MHVVLTYIINNVEFPVISFTLLPIVIDTYILPIVRAFVEPN